MRGADPDTHLFIPSQYRAGTRDRSQPVIKSLLNLKYSRMFPPRLSRRGPRRNFMSRKPSGIYGLPLISREVDFESKTLDIHAFLADPSGNLSGNIILTSILESITIRKIRRESQGNVSDLNTSALAHRGRTLNAKPGSAQGSNDSRRGNVIMVRWSTLAEPVGVTGGIRVDEAELVWEISIKIARMG